MNENRPNDEMYLQIILTYLDTLSVKKTSQSLGVSEVKVRKVLITEELWTSRTSTAIQHYRELGNSTAEIARILNTTEKAVQQYLPYTRGLYLGEQRSAAALNSADYRERIRKAQERTLKKKGQTGEMELKTNFVNKGNDKSFYQDDICRLHLELITRDDWELEEDPDYMDQEYRQAVSRYREKEKKEHLRVLREYGDVHWGDTISRDILVPLDMPLYALHYVIQRLFGWQNSHLHHFMLPEKTYRKITDDKAGKWSDLVGVLFQSPTMNEEDRFWADDYERGSFKNWLRKKYTGPYLSLNHGEGIIQSRLDMKELKEWSPYIEVSYRMMNGKECVSDGRMAKNGDSVSPMTKWDEELHVIRKECVPFDEAPMKAMEWLCTDGSPKQLLERLTIGELLAMKKEVGESIADGTQCDDSGLAEGEELLDSYATFYNEDVRKLAEEIVKQGLDYPELQPFIGTPTDTLYYCYDYGDDWYVKIIGSFECKDLIRAGRFTEEEWAESEQMVREKYRPVCVAADGLPLVDDVGGVNGFIQYLRAINPDQEEKYWRESMPDNGPYEDRESSLVWAKSLGWSGRKGKVKNLL